MSILKVARMGHPVLRAKARALDRGEIKSSMVQQLIDDLIDTMFEYHGVGLAAPQVHEGLRIFVAQCGADEDGPESAVEKQGVVGAFTGPVFVGEDVLEFVCRLQQSLCLHFARRRGGLSYTGIGLSSV